MRGGSAVGKTRETIRANSQFDGGKSLGLKRKVAKLRKKFPYGRYRNGKLKNDWKNEKLCTKFQNSRE